METKRISQFKKTKVFHYRKNTGFVVSRTRLEFSLAPN